MYAESLWFGLPQSSFFLLLKINFPSEFIIQCVRCLISKADEITVFKQKHSKVWLAAIQTLSGYNLYMKTFVLRPFWQHTPRTTAVSEEEKKEKKRLFFFTKWVISNTNQNLEPNCHKGTSEAVFNLCTHIKTSQCNYSHGKANANIATPQTPHINLIIVSSLIVGLLAHKKNISWSRTGRKNKNTSSFFLSVHH